MRESTMARSEGSTVDRKAAGSHFGVEGLDDLVPEGLSADTQIMVEGETGIGKSVLAAQFLYEGLVVGDHCIYIACDEPPGVMRRNMANFRLGTRAYERTGQLTFVDAYNREESPEAHRLADPTNLDEFFLYQKHLVDESRGRRTRLLVDSLSTVLLTADPFEVLEFCANRLRYLRRMGVLTLDNYVSGTIEAQTLGRLRHAYPVIVNLRYQAKDGEPMRTVQLGKLKSGQFSGKALPFIIDPRTGIVVQRWAD